CTIRLTELAPRDQLIHQTLQLALGDFLREVRVQHGDEALALARAPDLLCPLEQLPGFREERRVVAACGRGARTARRRRSRRCARSSARRRRRTARAPRRGWRRGRSCRCSRSPRAARCQAWRYPLLLTAKRSRR